MAAPAIGVRRRWSPGPNVEIDWSHPLAQGIVLCVVASGGDVVRVDTHGRATGNARTNLTATAGPYGPAVRSNGGGEGEPALFTYSRPLDGVPYSTMVVANGDGGSSVAQPMLTQHVGMTGSFGVAGAGWRAQTSAGVITHAASVTSFGAITMTTTTGLNEWFVGSMSWSPSSFRTFVGGALVASSTDARSSSAGLQARVLHDGNPFDSVSPAGMVTAACWWDRALSNAEHAALGADPFCFLRS